jgi:Tol biopolymer transport system component/DNA-binding winged helix-turn-helix (wHTH) protein
MQAGIRRSSLARFHEFLLDMRTGELRHDSGKVTRLPEQSFQILAMLLENPGEVVSREEIRKRLWPNGTVVEFEHSISAAMNRLRQPLGDSAGNPIYIETLAKRGYRWKNSVEWLPENKGAVPGPETAAPGSSHKPVPRWAWGKIAAGVAVLAIVAGLAMLAVLWFRNRRESEQQALILEASPFTALPGEKIFPAFSPDGSRISFGWNGDAITGRQGFDLYVKGMGSETLLRLTQHPSQSLSSSWSPDATQIAFHRIAGPDTGIFVIPALGGPERKLYSTHLGIEHAIVLPISWSPDGQWIAFADKSGVDIGSRVFLLSTTTSQIHPLRPESDCLWESTPSFSRDGRLLAFSCSLLNHETRLYTWRIEDGQLTQITSFQGFCQGLAWSADGKAITFSQVNEDLPDLREVFIKSHTVRRLAFHGSAELPSISPSGHLAFSSTTFHSGIWQMDLHHPSPTPVPMVASASWNVNAAFSPDGKQIAFQSGRSGRSQIWIAGIDGSELVRLSDAEVDSGVPQWSPDGKKVAFDARSSANWEIYISDIVERRPRKLVTGLSSGIRPHWSRDGKWIYFRSYEAGKAGIYRCPATGGDSVRLSPDPNAYAPVESFDGSAVYFVTPQWKSTLKQIKPALDGVESALEGMPVIRGSGLWTPAPGGIYFVPDDARDSLDYFDLTTRKVKQIAKLDKEFGSGLSLSPDGKTIIFSNTGDTTNEIMLLDHFH